MKKKILKFNRLKDENKEFEKLKKLESVNNCIDKMYRQIIICINEI